MPTPRSGGAAVRVPGAVALADAPLRRAYYVYGPAEGEAGARYLLDRLRERLRGIAGTDLAIVAVEGRDAWLEAAVHARTLALGGPRLIVAQPEGTPTGAAVAALVRALTEPAVGVTLYVREPPASGGGERALAPLRAGAWAVPAATVDRRAAAQALDAAARARGLTVEAGVAAFLYAWVGDDLLLALGELAKYADVLPPDATLTRPTVERLTPPGAAARVYPVGDAFLAGDLAAAVVAAHRALAAGTSPFLVTAHLARQARLLAQARAVAAERRAAGQGVDADALAAALGLRAWQARPLVAAASRAVPSLAGAFVALLEADLDMKGAMPPALAIDRLLWRLVA